LPIAAANLAQHKVRLVVALFGIGVSLLLLVIQISFLDAAGSKVTSLYDDFDFDIAIVSQTYQFLDSAGTFDRIRLSEARGAADIADTFALNVSHVIWTDLQTKRRSTAFLVGLDGTGGFIRDRALRDGASRLGDSRTVLADRFSSSDFGSLDIGTKARIDKEDVTVAGTFALGLFFYADGGVAVRNADFGRLDRRPARFVSIGLLRLAPGADPVAAKARIVAVLPNDVRVLLRGELIDQERAFFISTKPIGIMLRTGMLVAFLVGNILLLQALSSEIVNRIREFATLKAIGFEPAVVYGIGMSEAAMLAVGGFLPALLVGAALLRLVENATHLPTVLTLDLAAEVLAIALGMCVLSAALVLGRVRRADPAELF